MAEVNDLPFRLLVRRHGIRVCYTGMINTEQWVTSRRYQRRIFNTCPSDRPLVVQLAGSDHDHIVRAAADLSPFCDAIDLNLGCTQHIARRGLCGFYMADSPAKRASVCALVGRLRSVVPAPITAKIRCFPDPEDTAAFARQLEAAGVAAIAIHGRATQRDKAAPVLQDEIRRIVEAVGVPVIANGGVESAQDADALRTQTGAAAVMIGQALLRNPTHFDPVGGVHREQFVGEYLAIVRQHPEVAIAYTKKHMFQFFEDFIKANPGVEKRLVDAQTVNHLEAFARFAVQKDGD
jgi:tRNA-dihydrouridine synthase 1